MAKLKFFAVGAIVLCAAVVCVIIQHTSGAKYLAGVDALQQQSNRFTALTAEHDRLSNLVSRTSNALPENHSVELTKLRAEAEALRKQTNDFALAAASHNARPNALADGTDAPTPLPEDHEEQRRENMQARDFSAAFMWFAEEHSNRVPINLNQLAPYLTKMHLQMPPSDLFEIVFHGSTDQLHGIPFGSVQWFEAGRSGGAKTGS